MANPNFALLAVRARLGLAAHVVSGIEIGRARAVVREREDVDTMIAVKSVPEWLSG